MARNKDRRGILKEAGVSFTYKEKSIYKNLLHSCIVKYREEIEERIDNFITKKTSTQETAN